MLYVSAIEIFYKSRTAFEDSTKIGGDRDEGAVRVRVCPSVPLSLCSQRVTLSLPPLPLPNPSQPYIYATL